MKNIMKKTVQKSAGQEKAAIRNVLLMGYNGANNTGSEARLISIVREVREVFGTEVKITIPTICGDKLRRYINEDDRLIIEEYPTIYFLALRRLVHENDLILLTEGSCYMDTWSSCLLWAWLWVTHCAGKSGKYIAAYAVDSGTLTGFNPWLVRRTASKTDLIITRTRAAADRLREYHVKAPIAASADSAFGFFSEPEDLAYLSLQWPEASNGAIGIAAVDFYLWPVVFRLFGKRKNCYRWPYYYSDSRKRREARTVLAAEYAAFIDHMIERFEKPVVLLCMEELDEPFAVRIQSMVQRKDQVRIFSSRVHNASQMTSVLRSLDLLITSRYHAGVLSLEGAVPQTAIGHDQRLQDLYHDLEIYQDYFLDYRIPGLFRELEQRAVSLLENPSPQQQLLRKNNKVQCQRARQNPNLIRMMLRGGGEQMSACYAIDDRGSKFCETSVLITGATGFLGGQVTRLILEQTEYPIIVFLRGSTETEAVQRLKRCWQDWPELTGQIGKRVRTLTGDLCLDGLGLDSGTYRELMSSVKWIIHMAADIRLNEPLCELRRINVDGVSRMLKLADQIHEKNGLKRFSYVSTAYVAGCRKGRVTEEDFTDRYGFSNPYEQSKYEGESLVREAGSRFPVSVFRPGMVVGDSSSGTVKTFNTVYFPLRLYMTGKLRFFPVNPRMKVNLVPCDIVSKAIADLTFDRESEGMTFHLTLPEDALPTVKEMILFTRKWAGQNLYVKLPQPIFLPITISRLRPLNKFFREKSTVRSLLSLASYFEESRSYCRDHLNQSMGEFEGNWRNFFPKLLEYAVASGFMHRSERIVQEQVSFRLNRQNRPVRFFDIGAEHITARSSAEIAAEIEQTVFAMKQMGIDPGDRVAIIGQNCARYLVIDTAIGLCGAVSVPLYYSSPVREIMQILKDSGSRLLFAGIPKLLAELTENGYAIGIPVISFSQEDFFGQSNVSEIRSRSRKAVSSPAGFENTATLRYTSGTTGTPKGAAFSHANLRSMAETLAALPPWKARTGKIVYLSFLPMNHVVEGILASYAIFYAPAPIDLYYLEDFSQLQKVLPQVRPTIFFSVPRFYEKVWEQMKKHPLWHRYQNCHQGTAKNLLRGLLRWGISKKSGIDRCKQLIVGSAPINPALLEDFRELGLEIHNAYGLTEAPLITLNRYRENRIDTVGQPLPGTAVKIAQDGEILVKGPQVMQGYYRGEESGPEADESQFSLQDGWLSTGDLGYLAEDGCLVLSGRKKECIINSYGKNINPVKLELMLREAAGLDHVMVCGDRRPFCTAIFWGCSASDSIRKEAVARGVETTNQQLSHPEQIKRWILLEEDLTIEGDGLTANLKMKREALLQRYADVVESLYSLPYEKTGAK